MPTCKCWAFFLWHEIQDGRHKIWFFVKSVKAIALKPHICMEDEYNLGHCGHFCVSTITLSGIVAQIRSFHSFRDNCIHIRRTQTTTMNKNVQSWICNYKMHITIFVVVSANTLPQKTSHFVTVHIYLCQILTDFQTSFTGTYILHKICNNTVTKYPTTA